MIAKRLAYALLGAGILMATPCPAAETFSATTVMQASGRISAALQLNDLTMPLKRLASLLPPAGAGEGNGAAIFQDGSYNNAQISQSGGPSIGVVAQVGRSNAAILQQYGSGRQAFILQRGIGNTAVVTQK